MKKNIFLFLLLFLSTVFAEDDLSNKKKINFILDQLKAMIESGNFRLNINDGLLESSSVKNEVISAELVFINYSKKTQKLTEKTTIIIKGEKGVFFRVKKIVKIKKITVYSDNNCDGYLEWSSHYKKRQTEFEAVINQLCKKLSF